MKQKIVEFLERLEREVECFLPQNFVISEIDYRIPQKEDVQIFVSVQRKESAELTYTIDASGENADEMLKRLREGVSTLA